LWALNCGSNADELFVSPNGGSGGSGASGNTGAASNAGGATFGNCQQECDSGEYCSGSGQCIEEGTCAHADDCDEGTTCNIDTGECVPGGGCGNEEIALEFVRSNVLFMVDRSCSLTNNQFNMVDAAIKSVTDANVGAADWGLMLFPDENFTAGTKCEQDPPQVPVGPDSEVEVQATMAAAAPNGPCVTNISQSFAVAYDLAVFDQPDPGFVVFFTDGKQSSGCGGNSEDAVTEQFIADLLQNKAVYTYVIGFGNGVSKDDLNNFAVAGGKPLNDPDIKYYLTEDQASLDTAFDDIVADAITCAYELAVAPPEDEEVWVFFNDVLPGVPQDETHQNGWDYDPATNTITFYGDYCDQLKNGAVDDVDLVFGCPEPTPE